MRQQSQILRIPQSQGKRLFRILKKAISKIQYKKKLSIMINEVTLKNETKRLIKHLKSRISKYKSSKCQNLKTIEINQKKEVAKIEA